MPTKPGNSPITELVADQDMQSAFNSAILYPQRRGDELGYVQIETSQNPGVSSGGAFQIQGRLSDQHAFVTLTSVTVNSFQGNNAQIVQDVPMLPQMRIRLNNPTTITLATVFTATVLE